MKKQPTNEVTIADVLHYAADKCLAYDNRYYGIRCVEKFSCCAVDDAVYLMMGDTYTEESLSLQRRVMVGLKAMGCNTGSQTLFKKYGDKPNSFSSVNETVQGMRYMWLKWAALMAEEQGV